MNKNQKPGSIVGKVIIYVALIVFAITIIVPVAWVFWQALSGTLSSSEPVPTHGLSRNSSLCRTFRWRSRMLRWESIC